MLQVPLRTWIELKVILYQMVSPSSQVCGREIAIASETDMIVNPDPSWPDVGGKDGKNSPSVGLNLDSGSCAQAECLI